MADPGIRSIESLEEAYRKANSTMSQRFPPEQRREVAAARDGMEPLSYSLDVAWRQRMQRFTDTVIRDPRIAPGPKEILVNAADGINNTGLDQALKEWLIAADPFKEGSSERAICEGGEKLLKAIQSSFEIAAQQPVTQQLQPDLLALVIRVQTRLSRLRTGRRPEEPAVSVPHQMYLELRGAINGTTDFVRARVRARAGENPRAAKRQLDNWEQGVTEKGEDMQKNKALWSTTCDQVLRKIDQATPARKSILDRVFQSRNLQEQVTKLYDTIEGRRSSKDYVMRVREAAWPIQQTVDLYLRAIDGEWGNSEDYDRNVLDQTLCAVADRVLREVNFVITSQLARSPVGGGGDDYG